MSFVREMHAPIGARVKVSICLVAAMFFGAVLVPPALGATAPDRADAKAADTGKKPANAAGSHRLRPRIYDESPRDVTVGSPRPWVRVRLKSEAGGIDAGKTRLLVDGVDVSSQSEIKNDRILWRAFSALSQGQHQVRVETADDSGQTAVEEWKFNIKPTPTTLLLPPTKNRIRAPAPKSARVIPQ
jgi:hypothetical protein